MLSHNLVPQNFFQQALTAVKAIPVDEAIWYMEAAQHPIHHNQWSLINFDPHRMAILPSFVGVEIYARFIRTERDGNIQRQIYHFHGLCPVKIRLPGIYQGLLERQFIPEMSKYFNGHDKPDLDFITQLCQYFVHDGHVIPESIDKVHLSVFPNREVSESVAEHFALESEFYTNPTSVFAEEFERWNVNLGNVLLEGRYYKEARKENLTLGEALKAQYLTPVLQLLIKQWILRQLVSHPQFEALKKTPFFNVPNVDEVIRQHQRIINDNIAKLIQMPMPARQEAAKAAAEHNAYGWSTLHFQLAQRFSWLKLIVGHSKRDIHHPNDQNMSLRDKAQFYSASYLNVSLTRYMVNAVRHNISQAIDEIQGVIQKPDYVFPNEEAVERPLASKLWDPIKKQARALWYQYEGLFPAAYHGLKGVYLALWLPFLATFVTVSGITSAPFSVLRKMFGIPLGGNVDKAITVVEALKDGALLWFGLPLAYGVFVSAGSAVVGSLGMSMGAQFMNGLALTVMSPFIFMVSPLHYFATYPRWEITQYGQKIYKEESDVIQMIKGAASFGALRLVSIHGFFAALTLGVVAAAGVIGKIYHATQSALGAILLKEDELRGVRTNLNHSEPFKTLLGQLANKLEDHANAQDDDALLTALSQCRLTAEEKAELKSYLDNNPGESAGRTAIEKRALADPAAYIPSKMLVDRLQSDLARSPQAGLSDGLKAHINAIHDVYASPRFKNVA